MPNLQNHSREWGCPVSNGNTAWNTFADGIWKNSPTLTLLLGMCPTLATSSSVANALGMGLAATFVIVMSNVFISALRNIIPKEMRIPCFIVVIATFVTIVDLVMAAYTPALYKSLGIFIPLIVVNCIVLGRAEAYAFKNGVWGSTLDGIGMGLGFTLGLFLMSTFREILGNGSFLNYPLFGKDFSPVLIMIMPPGAFMTLGFLIALKSYLDKRSKKGA